MDSGSVPQMTSAFSPPERWSAAMRALSEPVVARNTSTLAPGCPAVNPATTASTVFCVTEVYSVRAGADAVAAGVPDDPAQPAASRTAAASTAAGPMFLMASSGVGGHPPDHGEWGPRIQLRCAGRAGAAGGGPVGSSGSQRTG